MKDRFKYLDFPLEKITFQTLMRNEEIFTEFRNTSPEPTTPAKIMQAYGEVKFPPAPDNRPYLFASIVESMDGKICYMDDTHGDLIAGANLRDPEGALGDFWVLNMLRFYCDGVIIGARILQTDEVMWVNTYDKELADLRMDYLGKKHLAPAHIVVSFDATDIPYEHMIFDVDAPLIIATSPNGLAYAKNKLQQDFLTIGPYKNIQEIDLEIINGLLEQKERQRLLISTGEGSNTDGKILLYLLKHLGLERVLVESPSYMTYLMSEACMDEMFMNYSSVFAAGKIGFGTFLDFSVKNHPHSDLIQIGLHKANFIATRQKMIYGLSYTNFTSMQASS